MNEYEIRKEQLMEMVTSAPNQRIRPGELSQKLARETGLSMHAARTLIKEVVGDKGLVYTYRDPCSYVEVP